MPLIFEDRRDLAWLVTRKQAVLEQFGSEHAAALESLDTIEDLQGYLLPLFSQAIKEGLFFHGTFIEDRLAELIKQHGWGLYVPYADDFAPFFTRTVAEYDLLHLDDYLYMECSGYLADYPAFFQAQDGYRYLRKLLIIAKEEQTVRNTPSLRYAIKWLKNHEAASEGLARENPPVLVPLVNASPRGGDGWDDILVGEYGRSDVEALLEEMALLEREDSEPATPAPGQKRGEWAAAVVALQQFGYLVRNCEAVTRTFRSTYGNVFSARLLQGGVKSTNEAQNLSHNRMKALIKGRRAV
jgi:hypothetical protein